MGSDADKLGSILSRTSGHMTIKKMIVPTNLGIMGKTADEIEALHEYQSNDMSNQVRTVLDSEQFAMFFVWNDDIYGTGDSGRVIYANMIKPNDDILNHKYFFATNLSGLFHGKTYQRVFDTKTAKDIQVVTKDYVFKKIMHGGE
jgi:hypothetical protein